MAEANGVDLSILKQGIPPIIKSIPHTQERDPSVPHAPGRPQVLSTDEQKVR